MPAQERMEELGHRLGINSLKKNWSREEWASIIAAQITVEERVEDALLQDGFSPDAILDKRHRIRGFLFYPGGTSFVSSRVLVLTLGIPKRSHWIRPIFPARK